MRVAIKLAVVGLLRESSFNMTRGEDEDIEEGGGGRRGGAPKICILQNQQEGVGGSWNIELLAKGAAKISSFEFQYLHFPPLSY